MKLWAASYPSRWARAALRVALLLALLIGLSPAAPASAAIIVYVGGQKPNAFPCDRAGYRAAYLSLPPGGSIQIDCDIFIYEEEIAKDIKIRGGQKGSAKLFPSAPGVADPAVAQFTINGNHLGRIFAITTTAVVEISNLNLINGSVPITETGGIIYNAGTLTVQDSHISQGSAGLGGGIYNEAGASLTLIDTVVDHNLGKVLGGGIYAGLGSRTSLQTTGPVNNICICSNMANQGAGIYNLGALSVAPGTLFQNNVAGAFGGALDNAAGNATIPGAAVSALAAPSTASTAVATTRFISNSAQFGGAIYNTGSLTLTQAAMLSNTATADGGAIESFAGSARLSQAYLAYNSAGFEGGGIFNEGQLTASALAVFSNTAASEGGGLDTFNGAVTVSDSAFMSNTATAGAGGALAVNGGNVQLNRITAANNQASNEGGGLFQQQSGTTTVANSTFSFNQAGSLFSAGIHNFGTLTLTSSSIISNSAPLGGNVANQGSGKLWLHNSIVDSSSPFNCTGTITSTGHNLDSGNSCQLHASGDLTNTNPIVGPLQNNGGALAGTSSTGLPFDGQAAWTQALLGGSPAIDTGDQANCPATDERGAVRPLNGCDIGAYEFGAKIAQTISFALPALISINQSPYPLGGSASSGLVVTYTAGGAACSLAGTNLLLNSGGPCSVTAHQAGDVNYNAAPDVVQNTTVVLPLFLPLVMK